MIDYTIQRGDTLADIAKRFLGDASRYREIARLNNIADANRIFVGQVIRIPVDDLAPVVITAQRIPTGGAVTQEGQIIYAMPEIVATASRDWILVALAIGALWFAFKGK